MLKINHLRLYASLCLCGLMLYGCVGRKTAEMMMSVNQYDEAITLYKEYLADKPHDINARNKLGYAYLKTEKWDKAVFEFKTVLRKKKGEPYAVLYLGMAYLNKGEYKNAIETWQTYRDKKQPLVEKEINRFLTLLLIKENQRAAEKALAEEKMLATVPPKANTVAVCYYDDFSPDKSLRAFQKGLAAMLITDLSKVKSFKVVERLRLQALLEEMKLGQTGIVDVKTAPRVGRLLGAENLIVGSLTKGSIRATSSLSSASKGKVKGTTSVRAELKNFYTLPGAIIKGVVSVLGVELSAGEIKAIGIPHTKSFKAFSYFGRALDELDAGNWKKVKYLFKKAIEADPKFELAQLGYDSCPSEGSPPKIFVKLMTAKTLGQLAQNLIDNTSDDHKAVIPTTDEKGGDGGGGH